jgi:phage tail-like protein
MPEATQKPPAPAGAAAAAGAFKDPYGSYNFKLVIQGVTEGHFTRCTGLGVKVEAIKYREGGTGQVVHRLPGRVEYADVTLFYGLTASKDLWLWLESAMKGTVQRRNVSIVVLAQDGVTEAVRFNLLNAWPSSWVGAPLDALSNEAAIEEMTLVYETLERV